jgi:hypothetical protein
MKRGDVTARLRSLLYVQSFWVLVIIVALVVLFVASPRY